MKFKLKFNYRILNFNLIILNILNLNLYEIINRNFINDQN